ncbi:MAG: MFS transporter [Candidatus Hodarchaeales archaeon]
MNWNIKLAYIQTTTAAVGFGIIQTAFSVYIYTLSVSIGILQPNVVLGNLFTVSGLASTIFVFPSGYIADRYRRDFLIRISVVFGLLSQFLLVLSTTYIGMESLGLLFISQLTGGLAWGISGPAAQALIADSIEPGNRSKVFATMHFANLVAAAVGPFLAVGLTLILGDTWQLSVLQVIIFVGTVATSISYLSVAFASDDRALVTSDERKKERDLGVLSDEQRSKDGLFDLKVIKVSKPYYDWVIPSMIVLSGLLIGFGAGATVAFFPVLFASEKIGYGLMPMFTYTVVGITNILTGFAGLGAQRLIRYTGRIFSMFLVQGSAIICLIGLIINLFLFQNRIISYETSVVLLTIFYISRAALMNASGPISRSIIMDVVPPNSRAKWNSLESLGWGMFWSLSASLGGAIVDTFGFMHVFLFTASIYTIATLLLLVIKDRVPKESLLTRSYQLGKLKTRNRIVLPSKSLAHETGLHRKRIAGQLTSEDVSFYVKSAKGGAGLVFLEPAFIHHSGRTHSNQIGIHDEYVVPNLKEVVKLIHSHGALAGIRIKHAGVVSNKLFHEKEITYPSDITAMNEDLSQVYTEYLEAAKRAVKAGFDVIELASITSPKENSSLIGQLISPIFNKRTDEYGVSLERRTKFVLDVIKGIKNNIPSYKMLSFHISLPQEGLSTEEVLNLVKKICCSGVDLLSLGQGDEKISILTKDLIEKIKKSCPTVPLVLHGNFDVKSAEEILRKGRVDLIGFEKLLDTDSTFPLTLR